MSKSKRLKQPDYLPARTVTLPSGKQWTVREWVRTPKSGQSARRRSRERAAGDGWTEAEFAALCERRGNKCLCCGGSGKLVADHVTPLYRGGVHAISNIQPLCRGCNIAKGIQIVDYRDSAA